MSYTKICHFRFKLDYLSPAGLARLFVKLRLKHFVQAFVAFKMLRREAFAEKWLIIIKMKTYVILKPFLHIWYWKNFFLFPELDIE